MDIFGGHYSAYYDNNQSKKINPFLTYTKYELLMIGFQAVSKMTQDKISVLMKFTKRKYTHIQSMNPLGQGPFIT